LSQEKDEQCSLSTGLAALGVYYMLRIRGLLMKPDAELSDIRKHFSVVAIVCLQLGTLTVMPFISKSVF
jgi:hypothetical protein